MTTTVKSDTCPKLQRADPLRYEIGLTDDDKITLRVTENNRFGGGSFSDQWFLLSEIERVLSRGVFTSKALSPIVRGGDNNNTGFVMAVLLQEGLVKKSKRRPQRYEWDSKEEFIKRVKALIAAEPPVPDFKKQAA